MPGTFDEQVLYALILEALEIGDEVGALVLGARLAAKQVGVGGHERGVVDL
jgi:hypothetical protein